LIAGVVAAIQRTVPVEQKGGMMLAAGEGME
jgi:hypothetical protein